MVYLLTFPAQLVDACWFEVQNLTSIITSLGGNILKLFSHSKFNLKSLYITLLNELSISACHYRIYSSLHDFMNLLIFALYDGICIRDWMAFVITLYIYAIFHTIRNLNSIQRLPFTPESNLQSRWKRLWLYWILCKNTRPNEVLKSFINHRIHPPGKVTLLIKHKLITLRFITVLLINISKDWWMLNLK